MQDFLGSFPTDLRGLEGPSMLFNILLTFRYINHIRCFLEVLRTWMRGVRCVPGVLVESQGPLVQPPVSSLESLFSQKCCHCCMLGRAAQARGQTCEPNLMISYQCGLVFRACCVKGQESSDFPRSDGGDLQDPGNSFPRQCVSILQAVCLRHG